MEAIEQGRLMLAGADIFGAVEEVKIHQAFGRHGELEALVWLIPGEDDRRDAVNWEGLPVALLSRGREREPLFSGLVQRACFQEVKGRPAVRLEAASYTILLDKGKKNRSFQKESRTYGELVRGLLAPYNGACIWGGEGENAQVGRFLMQYQESDWQFLRRVASLQGNAVVPEVRFPGAKLYIGVPWTAVAPPLEADAWRTRKSLAKMPGMADNGGKGILSGGTELLVEGRYEDHCLGDAVSFHGQRLIITGKESRLDGGLWVHDYALRKEGECHVGRICNPCLAGAAVKGTVLGTTLTCSRLALETDGAGEEAESEHIQPVYYAGGGKGYSGQPEKGDTQYLYFPTMREEDRCIIGGADAGKERIDALVWANEQERREEEKEERRRAGSGTGTQGSIAAAGVAMAGMLPPAAGGAAPQGGTSPAVAGGQPGPKNWSTPGGRRLVLDGKGIRLADGGRGRVTVLETGITVWSRRDLELETGRLYGAGADVAMEAGDYIWLHSGDSGLLLSPDGLQAASGRLELESPGNGARELPGEGMVQAILGNYRKIKTTLPPFTASDGSIVRRDGFDEVMRNEELFNFFSENVLGTDQYEGRYKNDIGQSPYLLFEGWLDELYGRSEAAKFWDHLSTLDGLQDVLDVVGFVWEGADLVNAVISLCRGHFKEAGLYCVSGAFLPVAGDLMVKGAKGVKGLSSLGMDLASGAARSSDEVIDTLCLTYRATDNAADLGRYVDDVVGMIPTDGSARLLDGLELLDGKTRIVYEAYDGAGNLYTYTRNLDELADLPGGRNLADGAMDQWGNGRTSRDMVMQGNAPGSMADDLHMYGMADGTGGRPQYDLYANNRPGGAAAGGAKTGDTINDATQQAARRADDAADAGRAAGSSGEGLDVDNHVRGNESGSNPKYSELEINNILDDIKTNGIKNNPLRQAYEKEVAGLSQKAQELLNEGLSIEEVAKIVSQSRRDLGIMYKNATPEALREYIYKVNLDRYGDVLGPTFDDLIESGKTFEQIIESASRPNSNVDKLLGKFEEWLRKQ